MANEFIHTEVGASLTEAEYDSVTGHSINNQARGDILISNTAASGLIRLAKGTEGHPLIMGANDPVWQSTESLILGGSITSGGAAAAGNFYHRFQSTFTSSGASSDVYGVRFEGTITGAAGDTTAIHNVGCVASITTQTASETIGVVSQLYLTEPGITKNVTTITTAATLYIAGAPTEGATNAALYVLAGETNIATLLVRDSLYLSERAGAQGDTGGRGQLWVKNESPCELWFTDDDGTDAQVQTGASDAGEGHITIEPQNYSVVGQGTWATTVETGRLSNNSLENTSTNNGDNLSYAVYLAAGTYTLRLIGITSNNRGITDIYVDAAEVGSDDWYSAGEVKNLVKDTTNIVIATAGLKALKFILDGRNGSAIDYIFTISMISLWRTA